MFRKHFIDNTESERWEILPLDEVADFINGLAMQKFRPKNGEPSYPVIKIKEMRTGITEQTERCTQNLDSKYIVSNGDIIFSWSGSLDVIIWSNGTGGLNQHLFKVVSDKYPKWFYYQWLLHYLPTFINIANDKATTMGHIKREHLTQALVTVPPKDIMDKFSASMNPMFEQIKTLQQQNIDLAESRDRLLKKMMRG